MKHDTLRHLYDELSHGKVTLEDGYAHRGNVIKSCEQLLSTYCQFLVPNVAGFLRSYDHFVTPAKFYVIPKIHKTPMVGRPIAASHSYITGPISIFVDELVKPKIGMPTVLGYSSELIRLLENVVLPNFNCFLFTMDIVSLYPNVDIKKAWVALNFHLRKGQVPETPLLVQLARLIARLRE